MTSAAELLYTRRSRYGRNDHGSDLGFDSSPEINLHSHSFSRWHHHRHDSGRCDPRRRSQHPRHGHNRLSHSGLELARVHEDAIDSGSGNITSTETLMNGPRLAGDERLPGDVLLAKERLLQRLRGVSLSENRSSHVSLDPSKRKQPGPTQDALESLRLEAFRSTEKPPSMASSDCNICRKSFVAGDKTTRLQCRHKFHSVCLDPWLRSCRDCPYCQRHVNRA